LVSHSEGDTQTEGSENRVLRKKFEPRRYEDGSWRRMHNDELNSLYSSLNIVRVIRSRRMRWVEHVACIEKGRRGESHRIRLLILDIWQQCHTHFQFLCLPTSQRLTFLDTAHKFTN
jgi:hypothetical protein